MKTECKEFLTFANHTSENSPKAQFFGYVRKTSTFFDYFQLYNRIIPDCRVCKFQKGNIIIPKIPHYWRYLESNSTNVCIFWTFGKFGQRNARIWGNLVNVMNKFTAKFGGYCPKLEKNMVGLYPKTYNQTKNVSVIHENI